MFALRAAGISVPSTRMPTTAKKEKGDNMAHLLNLPSNLTVDDLIEAAAADELVGFCLVCGDSRDGTEPDACNYKCYECGALEVFGVDEILIRIA